MTFTRPRRVAVVGAGMAGLTCASLLSAAGVQVRVFEKSRGPGGRLCTRRVGDMRFDHGAPGFEARSIAFARQVSAWLNAGVVARNRVAPVRWSSGTWERTDASETWVGVPRMSALGRFLARGVDVQLQTRVAAMAPRPGGWRLLDEQGQALGDHDFVVLACPAPQAAALLPNDGRLAQSARSVRFAPAWVLMWQGQGETGLPHTHIDFDDAMLKLAFAESARPERSAGHRWVVHARAGWSREHLEDAPELVAHTLARRFETLFDLAPAGNVWAHRWRYATIESPTPGPTLDLECGLAIVGDGTCGPGVEAAWHAGRELAEGLLGTAPDPSNSVR